MILKTAQSQLTIDTVTLTTSTHGKSQIEMAQFGIRVLLWHDAEEDRVVQDVIVEGEVTTEQNTFA